MFYEYDNNRFAKYAYIKLDMSTARRRLKSPRSLSGTSTTSPWSHKSISWSWMNDSHPFPSLSIGCPIPEIKLFRLWPWNSKVKVMGVVKGQGHTIGPVSYQLTSFSFHINQTNNSRVSEWVIRFNGLSRTADSEVHIVHISRVIIACTLKSLSFPHIDNTQSTSYK